MTQQFRRRAPTFEAMQWTPFNLHEIKQWLGASFIEVTPGIGMAIKNQDGRVVARVHDWIVKDEDGFYPTETIKFVAEFEEVT